MSQIRPGYEWNTDAGVAHSAEVIQTQTPINPGNSGGPLINDDGQLFGINSFIKPGEGLNFAVSVDEVKLLLQRGSARLLESRTTKPETCVVKVVFEGRNDLDDSDVQTIDRNCDSIADAALIIPDDLAKPFEFRFDDEQSGQINAIILDNDIDGSWDISYWDTTGDRKYDMIGHHPDGKILPSSLEPPA